MQGILGLSISPNIINIMDFGGYYSSLALGLDAYEGLSVLHNIMNLIDIKDYHFSLASGLDIYLGLLVAKAS